MHIPYEKISLTVFWIDPENKKEVIKELTELHLKLNLFEINIKNLY